MFKNRISRFYTQDLEETPVQTPVATAPASGLNAGFASVPAQMLGMNGLPAAIQQEMYRMAYLAAQAQVQERLARLLRAEWN